MTSSSNDDGPRGDLQSAVTMLAADNARLCEIALAADVLAAAVDKVMQMCGGRCGGVMCRMKVALEAYKVARSGQ
jgi:hypothetical protein